MPGANIVATAGCLNCHTYDGDGSSNLGAPDLTAIGTTNSGIEFFSNYVANPRKFGNRSCRSSPPSGEEKLTRSAIFLGALQGRQVAPGGCGPDLL